MTQQTARRKAAYRDLCDLPEHLVGQIINGELVVTPRPAPRHILVSSMLGIKLGGPFDLGEGGGPGGWWILDGPELHLGKDVLVPDLAGWRRENMPVLPEESWFSTPPDWVCEVLSPGTAATDRVLKMPIYAAQGVRHLWVIDPAARLLEVYRLEGGRWLVLGAHGGADRLRAEPFHEVELDLAPLWA